MPTRIPRRRRTVTADSISMISDGAATGKPVHILELDGSNTKFAHFHEAMPAAGIPSLLRAHRILVRPDP
ncbi:MAG TPA: ELM1/GtrOC1 family putative glycosyltransferase [Stellaceae bacterium]|nr:ELM1/GtrOC1 family putative glycosyltransferase [Stellaceae bacterium]